MLLCTEECFYWSHWCKMTLSNFDFFCGWLNKVAIFFLNVYWTKWREKFLRCQGRRVQKLRIDIQWNEQIKQKCGVPCWPLKPLVYFYTKYKKICVTISAYTGSKSTPSHTQHIKVLFFFVNIFPDRCRVIFTHLCVVSVHAGPSGPSGSHFTQNFPPRSAKFIKLLWLCFKMSSTLCACGKSPCIIKPSWRAGTLPDTNVRLVFLNFKGFVQMVWPIWNNVSIKVSFLE